ncbi:MAG: glycosyltransferase family 2 protein [Verrucomicrobiota bacterium]|nr:glycosyltransferase family 2 protein [Verrucomicrobiota bacterium]
MSPFVPMKKKVIVVMPAYNAELTLERTVLDIPPGLADEIIVVDDSSKDKTVEIAERLGLTVIRHAKNKGYGGNQKTCYDTALAHGADIVIMIHPDYQYDSRLASFIIGFIEKGVCDVMLGSRVRTRRECLSSGMPIYKYIANRILTMIENMVLGLCLTEYHTGYRAYSRAVLEKIDYHKNSDNFTFDAQMLIQVVYFGFNIGEVPVPCRYFKEASSINFWNSSLYGLGILKTLAQFLLQKWGIAKFTIFEPQKQ